MSTSEPAASDNLAYIDQLRGIAILMVIATHAAQAVPTLPWKIAELARYGQTGVQLFFVASAYTLCRSTTHRRAEPDATKKFYVRRFFRIAPLYYVAVLLYSMAHVPLNHLVTPDDQNAYTAGNVIANTLFIHGLIPSANNSIVPGGWSIATEMLFYALFPPLFALGLSTFERKGPRFVWMLAATSVTASIGCVLAATKIFGIAFDRGTFLYYSLLNQFPVFAIGMAIYFQHRGSGGHSWVQPRTGAAALVVLTGVALFIYHAHQPLLFLFAPTVCGLSFAFLLDTTRDRRFQSTVLARVGQVSYSMYVFHFLFVWYAAAAVAKYFPVLAHPSISFAGFFIVGTALTFLIALGTQRQIERPGIALGQAICTRLHGAAGTSPSRSSGRRRADASN